MNNKYIFSFSLSFLFNWAKCFASINYEASRSTCEEAVAPRGAAAHHLGTSGLSYIFIETQLTISTMKAYLPRPRKYHRSF